MEVDNINQSSSSSSQSVFGTTTPAKRTKIASPSSQSLSPGLISPQQTQYEIHCDVVKMPDAVCCHTGNAIVDPDTGHHVMLLFGGQEQNGCESRHNKLLAYVVETNVFAEMPRPPGIESRALHAAVVRDNKVIIAGGSDSDNNLQTMQLFEFDYTKRHLAPEVCWREITFDQSGNYPRRRERHLGVYCSVTDSIVFHGGYTLGTASRELFEFHFYSDEQREQKQKDGYFTEHNSNLAAHDHTGATVGQYIYVQGGEGSADDVIGDFHCYNIASISQDNGWDRVVIHNMEKYAWRELFRKAACMIALNERFLVVFGGTPYRDTALMLLLDLRKGELHPIQMNDVKIGFDIRFSSMVYIPELRKGASKRNQYHTTSPTFFSLIYCAHIYSIHRRWRLFRWRSNRCF